METSRSRNVNEAKAAVAFSDDEFAHLPSKQTWDVLTNLLYQTVLPLAKTTTFALDLLFTIITSTADQRRRISIYKSEPCLEIAYGLLSKSPENIMKTVIFDMGVERWVITSFLNNFLNGAYRPKQIVNTDDYYFSQEALMRHVRDMYAVYIAFRARVCERFVRLANSQAAKNHWQKNQFGLVSDKQDNEQNYSLSTIRAVDKLYPSEGGGTLAGYVLLWMANSPGSTFTQYNGEAFNLARPVRKEIQAGKLHVNNKAYDLDGAMNIPAPEENSVTAEDMATVSEVITAAQHLPQLSLSMLLHGFKQMPTPQLIRELSDHMHNVENMQNYETYLNLPMPDMNDLPVILPLSRSSRRDTENQRRRKEVLKMRKGQ